MQKMPTREEVEQWFTHGATTPEKDAKFTALHAAGRAFALHIVDTLPPGPESMKALESAQEAVMWGNTAISRS